MIKLIKNKSFQLADLLVGHLSLFSSELAGSTQIDIYPYGNNGEYGYTLDCVVSNRKVIIIGSDHPHYRIKAVFFQGDIFDKETEYFLTGVPAACIEIKQYLKGE